MWRDDQMIAERSHDQSHSHEQPVNDDLVPLITHYLSHLKNVRKASDRTVGNREEILRRADRELPHGLERANADELKRWLYQPDRATSSIATYWGALADWYRWAFDPRDPWLDGENPWLWMPDRPYVPPGAARPCSDEDLRTILTQAAQPYRLWALIAAYQGLRCIEIAGLDREHVTEQRLYVAKGKGGKARWHDTDPYVWAAVRELPPGPLAIDPRTSGRAEARYISVMAAHHFKLKLHVPVSMHMLRHWLGVHVQAAYRDARVTQEVLGHGSLSSTQIYTRATVEQQRAARATLPRLAE